MDNFNPGAQLRFILADNSLKDYLHSQGTDITMFKGLFRRSPETCPGPGCTVMHLRGPVARSKVQRNLLCKTQESAGYIALKR